MIIKADEDSMARMLGKPAAQIPESVLVEYELRLRLFHSDGNSGALGTIGIIDMLRSMKLGKARRDKSPPSADWSKVPADGTVRVMVRLGEGRAAKWVWGVYAGQVGIGSLAVRLDGDEYVHEVRRDTVRIARDEPMEPEDASEEEADADRKTGKLALSEPWGSLPIDDPVMVKEGDDYREGKFQGVQDEEVVVLVTGDLTPRLFPPAQVTCLEKQPESEVTQC